VFAGDVGSALGPLVATTGNDKSAENTEPLLTYLAAHRGLAGVEIGAVGHRPSLVDMRICSIGMVSSVVPVLRRERQPATTRSRNPANSWTHPCRPLRQQGSWISKPSSTIHLD